MRTTTLLTPLLASVLASAVVVGAGAATASAETPSSSATRNPDGSVTVTVPAEKVERFCTETGPKVLERGEAWVERVRGDAGTAGSVAWMRAAADRAQDAGRDRVADRLRERADRAERRVDQVVGRTDRVRQRMTAFCTGRP